MSNREAITEILMDHLDIGTRRIKKITYAKSPRIVQIRSTAYISGIDECVEKLAKLMGGG